MIEAMTYTTEFYTVALLVFLFFNATCAISARNKLLGGAPRPKSETIPQPPSFVKPWICCHENIRNNLLQVLVWHPCLSHQWCLLGQASLGCCWCGGIAVSCGRRQLPPPRPKFFPVDDLFDQSNILWEIYHDIQKELLYPQFMLDLFFDTGSFFRVSNAYCWAIQVVATRLKKRLLFFGCWAVMRYGLYLNVLDVTWCMYWYLLVVLIILLIPLLSNAFQLDKSTTIYTKNQIFGK